METHVNQLTSMGIHGYHGTPMDIHGNHMSSIEMLGYQKKSREVIEKHLEIHKYPLVLITGYPGRPLQI